MELDLAPFQVAVPGAVQGGPGHYLPAHLEAGGSSRIIHFLLNTWLTL